MSKKVTSIHEFYGAYPRKIWVTFNPPAEVIDDLFEADTNYFEKFDSDLFDKDTDAFCAPVINKKTGKYGAVLVFKSKACSPSVMAHEAVHAANYICDELGIYRPGYKGDEHYAYLVDWIVDCICKAKKDDRRK